MKNKLPMILKRINFTYEMLEQISEVQEKGHIESENETVRQLVRMGIFIHTMKSQVKDPAFMDKMKGVIKNEQLFEWLETMTTEQLQGIKTASEYVIEGKYKQKKLA